MKKYEDLTTEQKVQAENAALVKLLEWAVSGLTGFVHDDEVQVAIEEAVEHARSFKTPWFAHEYILDATYEAEDGTTRSVREHLEKLAYEDAKEAYYPEPGDLVLRIGGG